MSKYDLVFLEDTITLVGPSLSNSRQFVVPDKLLHVRCPWLQEGGGGELKSESEREIFKKVLLELPLPPVQRVLVGRCGCQAGPEDGEMGD